MPACLCPHSPKVKDDGRAATVSRHRAPADVERQASRKGDPSRFVMNRDYARTGVKIETRSPTADARIVPSLDARAR
jgi:hypothetical protein